MVGRRGVLQRPMEKFYGFRRSYAEYIGEMKRMLTDFLYPRIIISLNHILNEYAS